MLKVQLTTIHTGTILCLCVLFNGFSLRAQQFVNGKLKYWSEWLTKTDLEVYRYDLNQWSLQHNIYSSNLYIQKLADSVKKTNGYDYFNDEKHLLPSELRNKPWGNYKTGMFLGLDTIKSNGKAFRYYVFPFCRNNYNMNRNYNHSDSIVFVAGIFPSIDTFFYGGGLSFKLNNKLIKDSVYRLQFQMSHLGMQIEKIPDLVLYNFSNKPEFNLPITLDFAINVSISSVPNQPGETVYNITRRDLLKLVSDSTIEMWKGDVTNDPRPWWKINIPIKASTSGEYLVFTAEVTNRDSPDIIKKYLIYENDFSGDYFDGQLKNIWNSHRFTGYISHSIRNGPIMFTDLSLDCPGIKIKGDTLLCKSIESPQLHATGVHHSDRFLWSTGDTTASIPVRAPGVYWVARNRMGCMGYDTVRVELNNEGKITASIDTLVCPGVGITVGANGNEPGLSYSWNTGDTGCCISNVGPGLYVRSHRIEFCTYHDTFRVQYYPKPVAVSPHLYTPCEDSIFDIHSRITTAAWFNRYGDLLGETNTLYHRSNQAEPLYLRTQTPHCTYYDTLQIRPIFCGQPKPIWVPNAFTPEGNNLNELFTFTAAGWELEDMQVYNRWGELLYRGNSGWDGLHRGKLAPEGVYIYHLKLYHPATNTRTYRNGSFHLLR
jgi:gliding motility-associated-like protein